MEKIDLRTAMAQLRAAVTRDTAATNADLISLYVVLHGKDGDIEWKTSPSNIVAAAIDEYCANPNKYLP